MPSTTRIAGRVKTAASDDHMEVIATRTIDNGGLRIGFSIEAHGTKEAAFKAARTYQARFGVFRARARKRTFEAERISGRDVSALSYRGPYDMIECQARETEDGAEVRLVLSDDLYKELTITTLDGGPVEL